MFRQEKLESSVSPCCEQSCWASVGWSDISARTDAHSETAGAEMSDDKHKNTTCNTHCNLRDTKFHY